MRRYKHRLVCTPMSGPQGFSLNVWSIPPDAYVRAQVFLQGSPDLTGDATFTFGGDYPSSLTVTDNGSAQEYRIVPGAPSVGFDFAVDGGATFTDGEVTADLYLEAPPGFGFIYASDGGPGFMLTLQALQPD